MIDRRAWVATAAAAIRTASADKSSFHRGVDAGYRLLHRVRPPRLKTCTAADSSYLQNSWPIYPSHLLDKPIGLLSKFEEVLECFCKLFSFAILTDHTANTARPGRGKQGEFLWGQFPLKLRAHLYASIPSFHAGITL